MDRCPKDEPTGKNLVCTKALPISEKHWKNLLGGVRGLIKRELDERESAQDVRGHGSATSFLAVPLYFTGAIYFSRANGAYPLHYYLVAPPAPFSKLKNLKYKCSCKCQI